MMTNRYLKHGVLAMAACLLVSCMDDRYDLSDVDMNIGTSGDLTLPTSSTGDILLKNILEVTDDGIVQVVDGQYYLVEEGVANVPDVSISPITINRPVLFDLNTTVNLDSKSGAAALSHAGVYAGVPHASYSYTIKPSTACYEFSDDATGTVTKDIVTLEKVTLADNTTVRIGLTADFGNGCEFINTIHMDNMNVDIPAGLMVKDATLSYYTRRDGQREKHDMQVPAEGIDNENGLISFTVSEGVLLGADNAVELSLTFDAVFPTTQADPVKGGLEFANHSLKLKGRFELGGTFRILTEEFGELTPEQLAAIAASGSFDAIRPTSLDVHGKSAFDQDIKVTSFSGSVLTHTDRIDPITVGELPDFLNDPDVVLDLKNPTIYIVVDNPIPGNISTSIALTSNYTDGTPSFTCESGEIALPASVRCVVCIAENCEDVTLPEKYQGMPVVKAPVDNLGGLLEKLPETISVDVDDIVMDIEGLSVPEAAADIYRLSLDYMLYTPLEFGENTRLIYEGVEEGLADDLGDANKLSTKAIEIKAVAETTFPLDLTLSVDAQDANGRSLVGKVVAVDDVLIKAHKGPDAVSSQDVELTILPMEGHTMRELLEQMDRFVYRAEAKGDGKLLENAYLKLTDIKITIKGGISYDAN